MISLHLLVQENEHAMLIKRRERVDKRAASRKAKLVRQQSMLGDTRYGINRCKLYVCQRLYIIVYIFETLESQPS